MKKIDKRVLFSSKYSWIDDCRASLNETDIQKLCDGINAGDDRCLEEFILAHAYLVRDYIAFNIQNGPDVEDLFTAGFCGLMRAAKKYDPSRGIKFVTFAYYDIMGAVTDAINNEGHAIRVSDAVRRVLKERGEGLSFRDTISLDATVHTDDGNEVSLLQTLEVPSEVPGPLDLAIERSEIEELDQSVIRLPDNERMVIIMRYGLFGSGIHTLAEVGERLGVSPQRAYQLEKKAIKRLRNNISRPAA